jgi:hypothetical protein
MPQSRGGCVGDRPFRWEGAMKAYKAVVRRNTGFEDTVIN